MRFIASMERRLLDLERRLENMQRSGTIVDVKFDEDRGRWYAKLEDGEGAERFVSNWLPWGAFAHSSIKFSVPPRKGMRGVLNAPNGESEMAYIGPFHYGPDSRSPHGKPDEVFMQVELPDDESNRNARQDKSQQTLKVHATKDFASISIGSTTFTVAAGEVTIKAGKLKIEADVEIVGGKLTHNETNVGDTHKHGGVEPGGAFTNPPS